jgi:hypothetical protein
MYRPDFLYAKAGVLLLELPQGTQEPLGSACGRLDLASKFTLLGTKQSLGAAIGSGSNGK